MRVPTVPAWSRAGPDRRHRRNSRQTITGGIEMTNISHLAEQHIREHEARLEHVDELLARAHKAAGGLPDLAQVHTELDELVRERDLHAVRLDDLRARAVEQWRQDEVQKSGPMGIWDALAQKVEALVERMEEGR
jgi:hypothetical protein